MRRNGVVAEIAMLLGLTLACPGWAATQPIYTCVDSQGKKLTSDRPIPECANRAQRVLNADGSVSKIVPPTPTPEELAEAELAERRAAAERSAKLDAVRRDRILMQRFPNEAVHRRAREAALDNVRMAVRISEDRVKLLAAERKPLLDEAEFYPSRALPAKLRQALDANDAALDAQRALVQNQQLEMVRINAKFDIELERLKRLWGGAAPGSMGMLSDSPPVAAAASGPRNTP